MNDNILNYLAKLVISRTDSGTIINIEDIKDIIEFISEELDLRQYIVLSYTFDEDSARLGTYNFRHRVIGINEKKIELLGEKYLILAKNIVDDPLLYVNLKIVGVALHEVVHAIQNRVVNANGKWSNIYIKGGPTYYLYMSKPVSERKQFLKDNLGIKFYARYIKQSNKFGERMSEKDIYSANPLERRARSLSIYYLYKLTDLIDSYYGIGIRTKLYILKELRKTEIEGYDLKENQESPIEYFTRKRNEIITTISDTTDFKSLDIKMSTYERMSFGLPISTEDLVETNDYIHRLSQTIKAHK